MKKKPCKHIFANFKIHTLGDDDYTVSKCVHCYKTEKEILSELNAHVEENLEVIANQNVFNAEKYYDK